MTLSKPEVVEIVRQEILAILRDVAREKQLKARLGAVSNARTEEETEVLLKELIDAVEDRITRNAQEPH